MTIIANKQGLRAEGARRTRKAAQNTPLPAKDHAEKIALAQEAVAEAKAAPRKRAPRKAAPVVEVAPVVEAPAKPARKRTPKAAPAADLQETQIRAAQAKKLAARKIEEAQAEQDEIIQDGPGTPTTSASVGHVASGDTKAHRNGAKIAELGWTVEIQEDGDYAELIATRGDESIHQAWVDGRYQPEAATYTIADRTVRTRNVAEALRWAGRTREAATRELEKVASNRSFVKKAPTEIKRGPLPFDPATATDAEVTAALAGKKVMWLNRLSNTEEEAHVSTDPRQLRITIHEAHGERIVRTCSRVSGFRAFYLSAVMRVR